MRGGGVLCTAAAVVAAVSTGCREAEGPRGVGPFRAVFATTGGPAITEQHLNLMGGGTLVYFLDPSDPVDVAGLRDVTSVALAERDRGLVCFLFATVEVPAGFWSEHLAGRSCLLLRATDEVRAAFGGPAPGTAMILDRTSAVWWSAGRPVDGRALFGAVGRHRVEGTVQAVGRFEAAQRARLGRDGGVPVLPREPTEAGSTPAGGGLVVPQR